MKKYEYIRLYFDFGNLEALNRLSSVGWRVITVVQNEGAAGPWAALLEREIGAWKDEDDNWPYGVGCHAQVADREGNRLTLYCDRSYSINNGPRVEITQEILESVGFVKFPVDALTKEEYPKVAEGFRALAEALLRVWLTAP